MPYYGTIDATPLWLVLLHETWRWTADIALVRGLMPNAERALEWIDRYGDVDGDGFIEYAPSSSKGRNTFAPFTTSPSDVNSRGE